MRTDSRNLHQWARHERSILMAELFAAGIAAVAQFVSKAWRSSSSSGTNSSALS